MTSPIRTREQAKLRAQSIRADLQSKNISISHSAALEKVAKEQGFANWNMLSAHLLEQSKTLFMEGARISGTYLKHSFAGTIHSVQTSDEGRTYDIVIDFDDAVDVVESQSFSNWRSRIKSTVSSSGASLAKTGDGMPQLTINIISE